MWLACESAGVPGPERVCENGPSVSRAWVSTLRCQLGPAVSLIDGAMCAAGRSLPDMSLAFALMAAINSSTGSWPRCRTGSNYRTKPHRPRPDGTEDSHSS